MTNREDVANLNGILRKEMRNVHVESGRPLAWAESMTTCSPIDARWWILRRGLRGISARR